MKDLYEYLQLAYSDPINLNDATSEDLLSLYILNQRQVQNFMDYRDTNGPLLSIYELQAIAGFDVVTIHKLLPFVITEERRFDTRSLLKRIAQEDNKVLIFRSERTLEEAQGFKKEVSDTDGVSPPRFDGDRNKLYARFRTSKSKDFSIGLTMEKDAGERFNFDNGVKRYGPDFLSYHLYFENQGRWKTVVLGDYNIQLGQGLILGAGFNPGKGSETITTIRRPNTGIRPYTSVLESGFFRGGAATYSLGNIDLTGFYSNHFLDAGIQSDSTLTDLDEFISSIQQSGLHRTNTELNSKDQVREEVIGSNLTYNSRNRNFTLGFSFVNSEYNIPLLRRPNDYNQFEFQGGHNYTGSLFSNFLWQNLNLFGETAISKSGGIGAIGGLIASLSDEISVSLVLRNYQRNFHSFYGNAFGESSRNINEKGIYWGLKISPWRQITFTAYYDYFRFPYLRYRSEAPSDGHEYLARLTFRPRKDFRIYAQYRQESKERNTDLIANLQLLARGIKRNYLINLDYEPNDVISLKSRVQWSDFTIQDELTHGFALIQDFNFTINKLKIGTRFVLFDSDDFDNRQFAYEKDVLYAFSIPAYSGVGIRNYLLLQYALGKKTTIWFRIARTRRNDTNEIGSAPNKIDANHKTDLKFQIRYKI